MVNDVIEGIAAKLKETFGADTKISAVDVGQDLKKPCFIIQLISHTSEPKLAGRRHLAQPFDILYFPEDENDRAGMYEIAEQVETALEFIKLPNGDYLHGTKINSQIVDKVLHVMVDYNMFTIQQVQKDRMEAASVHSGLKG